MLQMTPALPMQLHGHLLLLLATLAAIAACPATSIAAGSTADLQQWTTYQVPTNWSRLNLADVYHATRTRRDNMQMSRCFDSHWQLCCCIHQAARRRSIYWA